MSDLRTEYDLACPRCGGAYHLYIVVTCTLELSVEGTDIAGGHEWDDRSHCSCPECGHSGLVADFRAQPERA